MFLTRSLVSSFGSTCCSRWHPDWKCIDICIIQPGQKKNRKGMVQKRLLTRKNNSCAKFTLTLGWNAVRCTSYIIHEKNLTLEIAPRVPEFRDLFSLGGPRCWLDRPAPLKGKLRRGLVHERFFLNESNDSTPETVKNSAGT